MEVFLQRLRDAGGLRCPEVTERHETCTVEDSGDGFKVHRCHIVERRFRACLDGDEEIESTTTTVVRPLSSHSGNTDEPSTSGSRFGTSAGPVMSADLGQMLDEFFEYATELQRSLQASGTALDPAPPVGRPWSCHSDDGQDSNSSSNGSSSLFERWFGSRRSEQGAAAASLQGPHRMQPSLPQLVKESSSNIQEI